MRLGRAVLVLQHDAGILGAQLADLRRHPQLLADVDHDTQRLQLCSVHLRRLGECLQRDASQKQTFDLFIGDKAHQRRQIVALLLGEQPQRAATAERREYFLERHVEGQREELQRGTADGTGRAPVLPRDDVVQSPVRHRDAFGFARRTRREQHVGHTFGIDCRQRCPGG